MALSTEGHVDNPAESVQETLMPPLRALLEHPTLALTLHCGDADTPFAAVRLIDLPSERAWLSHGDLRLGETVWQDLNPYLVGCPGAIGFALTPQQREVPAPLLEAAHTRGLCLFSIAPTTSVTRVRDEALKCITAETLPQLQGFASVQRYLLDSLTSPKPERAVLERLYTLLDISLVLLSPWGSVLARVGPVRPANADLHNHLKNHLHNLPEGRYIVSGSASLLVRVEAEGRLHGVLIAVGADEAHLPLLDLARSVLVLTALRRHSERQQTGAARAALLSDWLAGRSAVGDLEAQLEQAGLEPQSPYLLALLEPSLNVRQSRLQRRRDGLLGDLKEAGDAYFQTLARPALSSLRGDTCVWVFNGSDPNVHLAPLLEALKAASRDPFRLGLSLPHRELASVAAAYRQARMAAQQVQAAPGGSSFAALDPIAWVLEQPNANLRALYDHLVGPIKAADSSGKLWRTLRCYLGSPHDLTQLAAELHVHVNTLRYRLNRIETLLGRPLAAPETLAQLYLAVRLEGVLMGSEEHPREHTTETGLTKP